MKRLELTESECLIDAKRFLNYLNAKHISKSTLKVYLRFYFNTFNKYKYKKAYTSEYILKYLADHKSPSARAMIKAYLEYREIPFILPKITGRKSKKIIKVLTAQEKKDLRLGLYQEDIFFGIMFDLTYYCALRLNELLDIRFKDFYWKEWNSLEKRPCKLIIRGKGNKERFVYVPYNIMIILKKIINQSYNSLEYDSRLFEYSDDYWRQKLYEISGKTIDRKINPHLIRHTRTSDIYLSEDNIDLYALSKMLGHESLSTTQRYIHILGSDKSFNKKIEEFSSKR